MLQILKNCEKEREEIRFEDGNTICDLVRVRYQQQEEQEPDARQLQVVEVLAVKQ